MGVAAANSRKRRDRERRRSGRKRECRAALNKLKKK